MKKLLFILALFVPSMVFAAGLTLPQGGLGTTSVPTNYIMMGLDSNRITAKATSTLGITPFGFSTTSATYYLTQFPPASFSTTSASYFTSLGLSFSTTSTDYWLTTKTIPSFSTTSASYFASLGLAHSTTSANYSSDVWAHSSSTLPKTYTANTFSLAQTFTLAPIFTSLTGVLKGNGGGAVTVGVDGTDFSLIDVSTCSAGLSHVAVTAAGVFTCGTAYSTTSAAYFNSVGLSFSTTSASYFLSQNLGNAFSTTSANFWSSTGLAYSTTSSDYWLTQRQGAAFSTTSANYWSTFGLGHSTTSVAYQLTQTPVFTNGFISGASSSFTTLNGVTASTTNLTVSGTSGCSGSSALTTSATGVVACGAIAGSFSTTSANFWSSVGLGHSTTSTLADLTAYSKGFFFSTTSASFWSSVGLGFSTTSANFWSSVGLAHSTTSVAYQLTQPVTLGRATSTGFAVTTLTSCDTIDTDSSGNLKCGTDATGGGGGAWPWSLTTNFGVNVNSTSTPTWFTAGMHASGTSRFVNASSSLLTAATAWIGTLNLTNPLTVANGGTGVSTLTGVAIGNGTGVFTAGTTQTCTNQFIRVLSGSFAATCASVSISADVSGLGAGVATFLGTPSSANLATAVTDETGTAGKLVFDTSPVFQTSLALPQGAAPTVDAAGETALDTTEDQFIYFGASKRVLTYEKYFSFTISTSTWSGTTTLALGVAYRAQTWTGVKCFTNVGTVWLAFDDGTNIMNYMQASTTVGTVTLSTNNAFSVGEKRYVKVGNPATAPTSISCTVMYTMDAS